MTGYAPQREPSNDAPLREPTKLTSVSETVTFVI